MFKLPQLVLTSMLTALLTVPLTAKAEDKNSLIGIKHPPMPEGIQETGGWSVHQEISNRTHSITSVSVDEKEFLFLDRISGRDSQGKPFFQVVDVLPLPPIETEKEDVLGGSPYLCHINGEYDPTLIVIAQLEDSNTEFLTNIRKAWRVDLEAEKFKEIDTEGVEFRCENFGYGI